MAYEENPETTRMTPAMNLVDYTIEEHLFGKLAKKIAIETRMLQKDVQAKLGAQAFRSIFQQLDSVVVSLLGVTCLDDTTCLHVPSSVASRIPIVATSLAMHQDNVNQLGYPIYFAASSNEQARKFKSAVEHKAERNTHAKAAVARHNFVAQGLEQRKGSTIYLETLVATPGTIPPPPSTLPPPADNCSVVLDGASLEFILHDDDIDSFASTDRIRKTKSKALPTLGQANRLEQKPPVQWRRHSPSLMLGPLGSLLAPQWPAPFLKIKMKLAIVCLMMPRYAKVIRKIQNSHLVASKFAFWNRLLLSILPSTLWNRHLQTRTILRLGNKLFAFHHNMRLVSSSRHISKSCKQF